MNNNLPSVAVIGLGAMGVRLAQNLLTDGYAVTVHNRSPEPVETLVAAGATAAGSPREAAAQGSVVLVAVTDDDVSRQVWTDADTGALIGLGPRSVGVECSTISPRWARALGEQFAAADRALVEAPMIGSRPQAEARALVHLAGGPASAIDAAAPVLGVSAAAVHRTGSYGQAATLKLVVNALLATQAAVVAELLAVLHRDTIDAAAAVEILMALPVTSPAAARAAAAMTAGAFSPNFPVRLVEKDLRYLSAVADDLAVAVPMVAAALGGYGEASAAGHADEDFTAIARIR